MAGQDATAEQINDESMFVGKLYEVDISGVATIDKTNFNQIGNGAVKWSWKDEEEEDKSLYMKHQAEIENGNCSYMTQPDLPDDSKFPWVDFGAAIVPVDDYSSEEEEEDDESLYMKHQAEIENANCSYMTQPDLPEDSQFSPVDFRAAIVPADEYSSDEEEDDKSLYMKHQAELENTKPQPDGVDTPPTALLDAEHTGER